MPKKPRPASSRRRTATAVWGAIGLSVLGLAVVGLSFAALAENRNVPNAGETPGVTPTASATPSATPTEAPAPVAAPTRVLGVLDGDRAARAAVTACPEGTIVEVSDDAGATWLPAETATVAGVRVLDVGSDAFVAAVGADVAGCAAAYERSYTDGAAWEAAPDELGAFWFVDPADAAVVHVPGGETIASPCPVVQLAGGDDDSAAVLCTDSTVVASDDAGATWSEPVTVAGARALAGGDAGYVVAVSGGEDCAGVQVIDMTVAEGAVTAGSAGACFGESAGAVAVAAAEGATWVWSDDAIGVSGDLGETWQ